MKYIKKFEKFGEINPPIDIGYSFDRGMQGTLIGLDHFDDVPFMINFLKDKNIKYRLFFREDESHFLILIYKDDIPKLPSVDYNEDYYIPFRDEDGYVIGWFYQDMFDDGEWEECFIKTPDDMKDLEEKIELIKTTSKYNL